MKWHWHAQRSAAKAVIADVSAVPIVVITDHPRTTVEIERRVLSSVGARVLDGDGLSDDMVLDLVASARGIITSLRAVSKEMIEAAPELQVIARCGIGVDNIDVDEATSRGIPVTNVPHYSAADVAEHVMAVAFALRRQISDYDHRSAGDDWSLPHAVAVRRLRGLTLGVIGLGSVGRAVAGRAQAMGFSVIAYSPGNTVGTRTDSGVEFVTLFELAKRSHVVTLHAPLTDATTGLIDADFLRRMRSDAVLINTARYGIVDHGALAHALEHGTIAGAGLDVFSPEELPPGDRLLTAPNTIFTPHLAYYSEESLALLAQLTAESVAEILAGRRPTSIVNERQLRTEETDEGA